MSVCVRRTECNVSGMYQTDRLQRQCVSDRQTATSVCVRRTECNVNEVYQTDRLQRQCVSDRQAATSVCVRRIGCNVSVCQTDRMRRQWGVSD